ncbi:putative secreted protein, SAP11-like [Candidatus Phytoplasma luffae]|uniref:Secreted protein, SAP11-like n=1 Tax=Loofah witches'-broom phytoplasma TaxID=35773 RepID=A0A975FJX5_LOWBP|nr:SVM family protein [Candidatus Phytoplasma luffae]QTX02634.1 putative secreted protein, SAP11-like [Candidatus Phytoplasma luffae]QTX03152.1 putative secreted protein, SAP11-like [Candidatus Phytoplasma luffae]
MVKSKKQLSIFTSILFICLGLFLITNNQIYGSPKKDISSSKEIEKQDIKNYFDLYNTLENCSNEERNIIIQILSNSKTVDLLKQMAKEEAKNKPTNKEEGSSSQQPDSSKK